MMWRLLMRRCPTRSMTLVGDVAQVGLGSGYVVMGRRARPLCRTTGGASSRLTVNYRTPAAIMRIASDVLTGAGVSAPMPQSVREGDAPPTASTIPAGLDTGDPQRSTPYAPVAQEAGPWRAGRLVVIAPADVADTLRAYLRSSLATGTVGEGRTALDSPVVVLTVHEVKGLEFDAVVLVEPADDPQGVAPRRQRPLRRADPAHAAAAGADQRRSAGRPRRAPTRVTTQVAVAAPNTASVEAATAIAELGGGAVDAAVAALLVAMVNEPGVVSIDAGAFVTVWPSGGADAVTIDGCVAMPGLGRASDDSPPDVREIETTYGGGVTMTVRARLGRHTGCAGRSRPGACAVRPGAVGRGRGTGGGGRGGGVPARGGVRLLPASRAGQRLRVGRRDRCSAA